MIAKNPVPNVKRKEAMNTNPHHPNQRCCRRRMFRKLGAVGGLGLARARRGLRPLRPKGWGKWSAINN